MWKTCIHARIMKAFAIIFVLIQTCPLFCLCTSIEDYIDDPIRQCSANFRDECMDRIPPENNMSGNNLICRKDPALLVFKWVHFLIPSIQPTNQATDIHAHAFMHCTCMCNSCGVLFLFIGVHIIIISLCISCMHYLYYWHYSRLMLL